MILPIIVLFIIIYGLYKKVNIYDEFIEGAKESFDIIVSLFPCLLGMVLSINIFVDSNILNFIFYKISFFKIPVEIISLMILRPLSGSSSLVILNNILSIYGPDSFYGILSSVLQSSTDTTIYIITLYFGSVGIKKTRYALANGLLADISAFIITFIIVYLLI